MGKAKSRGKKKAGIDYDNLFSEINKADADDGGWHTGVSAMAMDDDMMPSTSPAAAAAVAGEAMDTADVSAKRQNNVLGVKLQGMKHGKRGNRTTAQKKRRTLKQEKALAVAEKVSAKVAVLSKKKQKKAVLKGLY